MLTPEQNERLTQVGPGTPAGELLRRYWQPVCPAAELTPENPKKRVRIMCEDLVAFRDGNGRIGVVENRCAHRGAALYYGFVEADGLRCPYHGWKYDSSGKCLETPFEPKDSPICNEVRIKSYPVQTLGGLIFVYMGPDPEEAPLLPRWDVLHAPTASGGSRSARNTTATGCRCRKTRSTSCTPTTCTAI